MLDSAAEIFFAAKGRYIGPGRYDVVFVTDIKDEHGEPMVGFAVAPNEEEWATNRSILPPELQASLMGPFVMVSLPGLDWLSGKYGKEACKFDLADTIHHELIHVYTGLKHQGTDDLCLRDSERFLRQAFEMFPADPRTKEVLLGVALIRRKTGIN